jgi:GxxExxY protein
VSLPTVSQDNLEHQAHQEHQGFASRLDAIGREIVDSAIKVHRHLGPGLLESAYEHCLAHELGARGIGVERQTTLPIEYDGLVLDAGYRLDLLVAGCVIVEIKSVEAIQRIHQAQMLTYLRLSHRRLGYLLNFNESQMRQGIRRFAL